MKVYRRQIEAFHAKFGRHMGPEDPFFFDTTAEAPCFRSADEAQHAIDLLVQIMSEAGVDAEAIYAFRATGGLFPSDDAPLSIDDQGEWDAAICEYRDKLRTSQLQ